MGSGCTKRSSSTADGGTTATPALVTPGLSATRPRHYPAPIDPPHRTNGQRALAHNPAITMPCTTRGSGYHTGGHIYDGGGGFGRVGFGIRGLEGGGFGDGGSGGSGGGCSSGSCDS